MIDVEQRLNVLEKQVQDIHEAMLQIVNILKKFETVPVSFEDTQQFGDKTVLVEASAPKEVGAPEPELVAVKAPEPVVTIKAPQVEVPTPAQTLPGIAPTTATKEEVEYYNLVKLLGTDQWPVAVNPADICDINLEQDKEDRAEGILELIIDVHLEKLKFLDFGCGEGHVVNKARTQNPRLSIGYDMQKYDKWESWEKSGNVIYTTDWNLTKNSGPYNVILMYDVIDHMIYTDEELRLKLKEIRGLLAPNGKVYVRCHPWSSRHGTHLYRQINKAYAHMVFSDSELKKMGYTQENVRKIKHPTTDYSNLWNSAGFRVISGPHHVKGDGVEPFFKEVPEVKARIQNHYKDSVWEVLRSGAVFPSDQMENQFIDYILS